MKQIIGVALAFLVFSMQVLLRAETADSVSIAGDVPHPLQLDDRELHKRPRRTLSVAEHGQQVTYEGVSLHELLREAGAPSESALRGKALTTYVLAEARDGYQVVYTLAEMDPAFTDEVVLLADRMNEKPLGPIQGPFRLVIRGEKKPARSIRMLTKITVVQLAK